MERHEIESVYSRDAFAEDRNRNARTESEVQHGLLVAPSEVRRLSRHAGEVEPPAGTGFIAPFPGEDYDGFIERVLVLSEALDIPQADDETLRGLRQ